MTGGNFYPEMPPALDGETVGQYTDRVTGADGTGRRPYDHPRNRQCSIGYHDECSDPTGEHCKCPCHCEPTQLTPREEFEEVFGPIHDPQWQWLKNFCVRRPVTGHARTYTGEFPPDGSTPTVDDLVAALATSVERVRIKYAIAVRMLAEEISCSPDVVLARIDVLYTLAEHIPFRVGGE